MKTGYLTVILLNSPEKKFTSAENVTILQNFQNQLYKNAIFSSTVRNRELWIVWNAFFVLANKKNYIFMKFGHV